MRAILLVTLLAFTAVSGCSGSTADLTIPTTDATSVGATSNTVVAPRLPVTTQLNLSEDGNVGVAAGGCVFVPDTNCQFVELQPGVADFTMKSAGNLTALSVTLTWTATSPATDTITVGAGVVPDCDACDGNSTYLGETSGTSPLTVSYAALALPLDASNMIHFYIFNTKGAVSADQLPGFAYASADQAFHIEAQATVVS